MQVSPTIGVGIGWDPEGEALITNFAMVPNH